ncbi:MAG: DUF2520 domain-containing protein [Gammaproteobacteria bacterium]|jgi:predicted short-subunit dehydrogenase-like oxidoreductase (DUF2520 family)
MGQVPHYLMIGDGRLARHMAFYFSHLGLSYHTWSRRSHNISTLPESITKATHILLLIADDAIPAFIENHLLNTEKIIVHFSGSLMTPHAYSAHPLMSFTENLYTPEIYQNIWFIIEKEGLAFSEILPGLPNQHAAIPRCDKPLYHSLCVLSSNFTCLLWQKLFDTLATQWQIPPEAAHPILQQVMHNLMHDYKSALTGPLVRNDLKTITHNLQALENDPYQDVYQAFVKAYQQEKP